MAYNENKTALQSVIDDFGQSSTVTNFLRPNAFKLNIKEIPKVSYTCQTVTLPGVNLGIARQTSPFIDMPLTGDKLTYEPFSIRFLIAEDMSNYLELYQWLVALGFPNSYNEYTNFTQERLARFPFSIQKNKLVEVASYSDATLIVLESNNNPKIEINFRDLFPTNLNTVEYDTTSTTVEYLVGTATFIYRTFDIKIL